MKVKLSLVGAAFGLLGEGGGADFKFWFQTFFVGKVGGVKVCPPLYAQTRVIDGCLNLTLLEAAPGLPGIGV